MNIGSRRELLIDQHLVERFSGGARLRLHRPERREIAIVHDQPWEGAGTGYHTIFRDGDVYRMYYKSWAHTYNSKTVHPLVIAYAESRDGIQWHKPELGIVSYNGSRKNNIILDDIHGGTAHDFSPFVDQNPACAADARYKAVGYGKPKGLYAYKSSDGIHWRIMQDAAIISKGAFDTQNIAFWDPQIRKYRAYIRDFDQKRRDIKTCVSDDFLNWSEPEWLDYPGAPSEQLYTNQILPYYRAPHIYIGFPARYVDRGWIESTRQLPEQEERTERARANTRFGTAVTDTLLMTSRDGRAFHRWDEAFVRPGLRTRYNWSYGDNYLAWHVVETKSPADDEASELSLYSVEGYFTGVEARLRRLALRIDGFASAFSPLSGGELLSKPFLYQGASLTVNFSTSAGGELRFELQDPTGRALPGCAAGDCETMFGDALEQRVAWKGKPDLRKWAGKPVRFRVLLKDADLYSFRFA
ncbi:MAG: hypothetical protein IPM24_03830 [Bryobacterales bacterium]|nr:hypothetical protein [Bryobacterales bacterium]